MIVKCCDVCNSKKSEEIKILRKYSNDQEIMKLDKFSEKYTALNQAASN